MENHFQSPYGESGIKGFKHYILFILSKKGEGGSAEKDKKKSLFERFRGLLDSMKFAVALLVILAVVSLIGVLLPQFPPEGYQGTQSALFLQKYGRFFGSLFVLLGLDHLFTAWWYYLLLGLLCLNIIVCSLGRLGSKLELIRRVSFLEDETDYRRRSASRSVALAGLSPAGAARAVSGLLAGEGYRVFERPGVPEDSGADRPRHYLLSARRGALGQLGSFISHLSMVLIIIGAAIGYIFSFDHFQWLGEGERIIVPDLGYMASPGYRWELLQRRACRIFGLGLGETPGLMRADSVIRHADWRYFSDELHFEKSFVLRLDKFEALFTPQGKPKAYLSTVTVLGTGEDGSKPLFSRLIKVNDPLIYKGVYFYQSSYAPSGRMARWVELTVTANDSAGREPYRVRLGVDGPPVELGGSGADSIRILRFVGSFKLDKQGRVQNTHGSADRNPAVEVVITSHGTELMRTWAFKNFPDFSHGGQDAHYSIAMGEYEKAFITGLMIRTHNSQSVIWIGFAMMVAGLLLSFYVNHRRVWVMAAPGESQAETIIHLAGMSYKWKHLFRSEFEDFYVKVEALGAGKEAEHGSDTV
ncbi:MAG: cytochrome c biogenesis protein ResB [Gemmatimonadota bacterium]|nr:cytochrome c biogenesis protein ResB [Gemmatimonadota bacterium]